MSVIRQPGVLGRTTRRRLVGMTAALTVAVVEALAVGLWFGLVVDSRTTATGLVGLVVLLCGLLLRASILDTTVSESTSIVRLQRVGTVITLAACWIVWLLVAELIGGATGVTVATVSLVGVLTAQFCFERRVFQPGSANLNSVAPVLSAAIVAVGAAALLTTAWFAEWLLSSPLVALEIGSIVVRIESIQFAAFVFGLCVFLAHQHRFQRLLDSEL